MDWPILSTIILIPLLGSLTILLINSEDEIGKRNIKIVVEKLRINSMKFFTVENIFSLINNFF